MSICKKCGAQRRLGVAPVLARASLRVPRGVADPDPHQEAAMTETERLDDARWQARQQAISECIADLAEALHLSPEQGWPVLIEMTRLFADQARSSR